MARKIDSLLLAIGSIRTHIMLVNAGVRSVALIMVRNEHIEECKKHIKAGNLFMVLNPRGKNHTTLYIFKHPCVENVINFTLSKPYDRKALMEWVHGKMFGYNNSEIDQFITSKGNKNEYT